MLRQAMLYFTIIATSCLTPCVGAHEDERPATTGNDRLGEVSFPISCNQSAQREFNRAVAILHSFFYIDAVKSFTKVTALDRNCAMGYWGIAMSVWYPLWYPPTRESLLEGRAAVEKAAETGTRSSRERDYIDAIATFYRDFETLDHQTRAAAYERAMHDLYMRYPDDHEAAAFYALALQATADPNDKTYRKQLESGAILEKLYAEQRDHPGVAHYLIHAYDYPELASRALDAAHHYGEIAPAMPHALHMPSHTFIALGLWDESIRSNLAAQASARKAAWVQEELHAMDYLVYAYLQNGRTGAAAQVKDAMAAVKIEEKHSLVMDYAIAAAPARYAIERRQWLEAARLTSIPSTFAASTALTFYARALGFARGNQADEAQPNVDQLAEIRERLIKSDQRYWAKQVDIQLETAMAWVAWARGKSAEALSHMHAAVALEDSTYKSPVMPAYMLPARELLGDLLLELNQPDAALAEYERSLRAVPQRFNGLYGAARAAELAGDGQKARRYYSELVRVCDRSDSQRSELEQAKRFLAGPGQRRP